MIREIKFRAWDNHNKKMHKVAHLEYADDGFPDTLTIICAPIERTKTGIMKNPIMLVHGENGILLQFTGHSDKSGVNIYDGDFVKNNDRLYQIEWLNSDTRFICLNVSDTQDTWYLMTSFSQQCEIVGNRFENPELLTKTKTS